MVIYRSLRNNKNGRPASESQNDIRWSILLPLERRQNLKENVWSAQNTRKGENPDIDVVNFKQGYV
jgi:hypothetical protein